MRIATIGSPLPLLDAEPLAYRDATALNGFDAVLWNPNALFAEYAPELADDGALSVAGSQAFLADLRRRRQEMRGLLDEGGTLVIEPPLPATIRVHTLEAVLAVPLSQALPIAGVTTTAARPRALGFRGGEPFRAFWARAGADLAPVARLDAPHGEVLFRDTGDPGRDGVYGLYWAQQRGRVLLLPPPRPDRRDDYAAALAGLLEALAGDGGERLPRWTRRYLARDERPLRATLDRLDAERAALDRQIAAAQRALYPLERRKLLFTAAGRSLVEAVSETFWALGCSVLQGPFGETDLVIEHEAGRALAQIVADTGPIADAALARLDVRVAELGRREGARPKGLLIINPHRLQAPDRRPAPAVALGEAAAAQGHLIVRSVDLLGILVTAGDDAARRHDAVVALLHATGLWRDPAAAAWMTVVD
jgi:hypothetical protein